MRFCLIVVALFLHGFATGVLRAQSGTISSPIFTSIGIGSGWQTKYATGIGVTATAQMSLIDLLAKERETTGFRIRDVWGGHVGLGVQMQPDSPMVAGGLASKRAPVWYDVGFEWAGLQLIYVVSERFRASIKGQMTFSFNSSAYYEGPFPTSYHSGTVCGAVQTGPIGIEIGKGWDFKSNGPNYFTLGASYQHKEKNTTYRMVGFRFTSHSKHEPGRIINGALDPDPVQKNYLLSVFLAKAL